MTELKKTPPKTVDQDPGVAVDSTQPAEAPVAAPPVKLWLGVSLWLILCLVYLAVGATGFFELWLIVPFIGVLVASQALEKRLRTRRNFGLIGIFLALMSIVLGVLMLVWPANKPYVYPLAVFLIVGGLLALSCLVRRSRVRLFPTIGLNPDSALHTTVAVMFVFTFLLSAGIFVLILGERGETILIDLKDPIISLLSDVPLALAGVGFMLRRDLKKSLERLGFFSITVREFREAVVLTVLLLLAVVLLDFAERILLPEIHALEDRFPMKFGNVSPVFGIPAVSLAAGVGEEAVFRGALQPRFGIVPTALLFAALHAQYQVPGIIVIFIIGIVLGVTRRRKSTTFTACVHMLYDIGAFLLPDF